MNLVHGVFSLLIGYFFGCFQTSYFISKIVIKKDIREMGSGNAGASNMTSELGWQYGILTGVSDVLKAFMPAKLIVLIFPYSYQAVELMAIAGVGAVLGHIYPFFMSFRGGKGVACYIGMMLAIDWKIGVAAIIFLIVLTIITDYVSIASILLYVIVPCLAYYSENYSDTVIVCTLILLVIGICKHWVNIQNLLAGNETGFRSVFKKNK